MTAHRRVLFLGLVVCGIAASQGIELFVNRILRPDAEEIAWISEAVLALGFVVVTWLWVRLRETQIALTDLERQQIVTDTQLTVAARVQTSLLPALPGPSLGISWHAAVEPAGKVGGDYYDFVTMSDGRMCVVIGDVSGKGVAAAVFLANVRATLRALARESTAPPGPGLLSLVGPVRRLERLLCHVHCRHRRSGRALVGLRQRGTPGRRAVEPARGTRAACGRPSGRTVARRTVRGRRDHVR